MLESPELDPGLQVWPQQCWGEAKDQLPRPAGNIPPPNAAQDTAGHLCPKGTLLAYIQLYVHQTLRSFLHSSFLPGQPPACTGACPSDHRAASSSPPRPPHSSHYLVSPLSFCSYTDLPPPLHSQPPSSAHMSTVCSCSANLFLFKIADNSSFLPQLWTHITLQHPFVIDSTSIPDFPHRKNKSWIQAAAIRNLPGCIHRKEKEQLSEKKKRLCMIACIIQEGFFLQTNNYCHQGRICTKLTGTLSIRNECQHKVWNTQRFNMIFIPFVLYLFLQISINALGQKRETLQYF